MPTLEPAAGIPAEPLPNRGAEPLHAQLEAAGARLESPWGRITVLEFGDVPAEHWALVGDVGLLDETDRAIVRVRGARAAYMLNRLVSNDLGPLDDARSVYAFLLTPKGRPVAEIRVVPVNREIWLDAPAACARPLLDYLAKYLPPMYASVEFCEDYARLSLVGPRATAAVSRVLARPDWPWIPNTETGLEPLATRVASATSVDADSAGAPAAGTAPRDTCAEDAPSPPLVLVTREPIEGPGYDFYLPADHLLDAWRVLGDVVSAEGGRPVGRRAVEAWRVERGVPAYGADIGLDNLPQETGQEERAISYTKGCYTGQEVVARLHYRGHVNRLLRGLDYSEHSTAPPRPGDRVYFEGRAVGHVTTAALSPRFGPIALGYVRNSIAPEALVSAAPDAAACVRVVALPFTST
ncbi:MAG: YgfZ/GcvT domain-containing protein [Gemmatimonadota bacterium]